MGYSHLQFRSDHFQSKASGTDPAGQDLLEYLLEAMVVAGFSTGEPVQEDWGWCSWMVVDGHRVLLGCGVYPEHDDGWLCFVERSKLSLRRLFNPSAAREAESKAAKTMHQAIVENSHCHDRKWWTDKYGSGELIDC